MPLSDAEFCTKVCRVAKGLGYTIDKMDTSLGWSFAFVKPDGTRVAGSVQRDAESALVVACKKLLPEIYQHL